MSERIPVTRPPSSVGAAATRGVVGVALANAILLTLESSGVEPALVQAWGPVITSVIVAASAVLGKWMRNVGVTGKLTP